MTKALLDSAGASEGIGIVPDLDASEALTRLDGIVLRAWMRNGVMVEAAVEGSEGFDRALDQISKLEKRLSNWLAPHD